MIKLLLPLVIGAIFALATLIFLQLRYKLKVNYIWQCLQSEPKSAVITPVFQTEMIAELPEPVQRYFLHAIAPGSKLSAWVQLEMKGNFRLQPQANWLPMQASQIISSLGGFVWRAKIGQGLTRFSGADYCYQGKGGIRFSLGNLFPLVDRQNQADISRSAIGRLGAEYASWLPSTLLPQTGVTWQAKGKHTIQANCKIANEPLSLTLTIDDKGKLLKLTLPRWGKQTQKGEWEYIPFAAEMSAEQTYGGYTIPSEITARWWLEKDNYFEFFRARIEKAQFA
ncbi:MAG: hypothetical protein D6756_10840 [Cyanobacteria bacterium J083]|nr:MAG: hypothetical protein D6756_10840 [Cyanobacteria bacterium J083]